jgi:outer membrane protein TolC
VRQFVISLTLAVCAPASAQQWTLAEAVRRARMEEPSIDEALARVRAAAAGVQLARTAYLPKGEFHAQANRGTRNNIFGMVMPNPVIAGISGPPLAANAGTNVWGTATGFLVTWEPFDLGQRGARVAVTQAARAREERAAERTRFEIEAAAAGAFLTVLAADESVKRAQAALDRAKTLETVAGALASAGLRPDADLARARAERAGAEALVIQATQSARDARSALVQLTGGDPGEVRPDPGPLLGAAREVAPAAATHPGVAEQEAAIAESQARRAELAKAWRPKFIGQSALYARGTGALANFVDGKLEIGTGGPGAGLGPNIYNWGIGLSVLFPFLDLPAIRAQREAEAHRFAAESKKLDRIGRELKAQRERAESALEAARGLAAVAPIQLEAARATAAQAEARYKAGLAPLLEAADAQRVLAQAEIDDALAHLNVWRAQLAVAVAAGDLKPLLEAAAR